MNQITVLMRVQKDAESDAGMRRGIFDAQDVLASALPQDAAVLADVPLLFERPL